MFKVLSEVQKANGLKGADLVTYFLRRGARPRLTPRKPEKEEMNGEVTAGRLRNKGFAFGSFWRREVSCSRFDPNGGSSSAPSSGWWRHCCLLLFRGRNRTLSMAGSRICSHIAWKRVVRSYISFGLPEKSKWHVDINQDWSEHGADLVVRTRMSQVSATGVLADSLEPLVKVEQIQGELVQM